jgi:thymidylate synthase (FAD)
MTDKNEIIENINYKPVLDHGFVGLVDSMGDDSSIVQAARVSYGKGTKTISEDRGLIRYLLRHKHTTPFEMVEFKFHCKMPIFVARQWIRHRTASVNEASARYSLISDDFYIPELEHIKPQSKDNKQGRAGELNESDAKQVQHLIRSDNEQSLIDYQFLIGVENPGNQGYMFSSEFPGIAREIARTVSTLNNYTEWYWKIDLHNLFHFLKLRLDAHAQYEIRVYAQAMYELIKSIVPVACEAFEEYVLNARTFSAKELVILKSMIKAFYNNYKLKDIAEFNSLSNREQDEFIAKLGYE